MMFEDLLKTAIISIQQSYFQNDIEIGAKNEMIMNNFKEIKMLNKNLERKFVK